MSAERECTGASIRFDCTIVHNIFARGIHASRLTDNLSILAIRNLAIGQIERETNTYTYTHTQTSVRTRSFSRDRYAPSQMDRATVRMRAVIDITIVVSSLNSPSSLTSHGLFTGVCRYVSLCCEIRRNYMCSGGNYMRDSGRHVGDTLGRGKTTRDTEKIYRMDAR